MSEARVKLAAAQAEAASVTTDIQQMEQALSQARMDIHEAEASLKAFTNLDKHISQWRASELKRGRDARKLPDNVKKQLQERASAQEELEQSLATFEVLQQEIAEAKTKLGRLMDRPEELAVDVLLAEVISPLAEELTVLSKRRWELQQLLLGFYRLKRGHVHNGEDIGASSLIAKALQNWTPVPPGQEVPYSSEPEKAMTYRWRERVEALLADSGAELEVPPPVLPGDFRGLDGIYPTWLDEHGKKVVKIVH